MFLLPGAHANHQTQVGESIGLLQTDSQKKMVRIGKSIDNLQTTDEAGAAASALLSIAKAHGQWTNEEKEQFIPLITSLVSGFEGHLSTEHDADQTHWTTEEAKEVGCHTEASENFLSGEVSTANEDLDERKAKLKSCHAVDKAWQDYKAARECELPQADVAFGDMSTHDEALKAAMAALAAKVSTYHSEVPVSTILPTGDCSSDQVHLEDQMCLVRRLHRWTCEAQAACSTTVDLASTKVALRSSQDNRRASKLSFKKVICHVNEILGLTTANGEWQQDLGDAAKNAPATCNSIVLDASDLVLNLEMPQAVHCKVDPEVSVYPSTTDTVVCSNWVAQEYQSWGSDYTAPTACKASCDAMPTPTNSPHDD